MFYDSIKQISAILDLFSGVHALEIIDENNIWLRYQCPVDEVEKRKNFEVNDKADVGIQLLEFLEQNFKQR